MAIIPKARIRLLLRQTFLICPNEEPHRWPGAIDSAMAAAASLAPERPSVIDAKSID